MQSCAETSEKFISESSPDGTSVTKHCIPNCREANIGYKLYGDGVYSGDSQVCMAAIHAGVIEDGFGGDVAIVKQGWVEITQFSWSPASWPSRGQLRTAVFDFST